jgi:hypothetical protein
MGRWGQFIRVDMAGRSSGDFGSMSNIYLAQQLFALIETLPFRLRLAPYR